MRKYHMTCHKVRWCHMMIVGKVVHRPCSKCISSIQNWTRTPLSSPCQLRPEVQLSYLRLSHYTISESESVRREAESELYQKGNAHTGVVTGLCITVLCDTIIRWCQRQNYLFFDQQFTTRCSLTVYEYNDIICAPMSK